MRFNESKEGRCLLIICLTQLFLDASFFSIEKKSWAKF